MTTVKYAKLTRTKLVEVHDFMKDKIEKLEGGFARYLNGWDDERIAAAMGVKRGSIASLRLEMFGKVQAPVSPDGSVYLRVKDLQERVTALETHHDALIKHVNALTVNYNKLVDNLAVGQIAKVGHLSFHGALTFPLKEASK